MIKTEQPLDFRIGSRSAIRFGEKANQYLADVRLFVGSLKFRFKKYLAGVRRRPLIIDRPREFYRFNMNDRVTVLRRKTFLLLPIALEFNFLGFPAPSSY